MRPDQLARRGEEVVVMRFERVGDKLIINYF